MNSEIYSTHFKVQASAIDERGHVNNLAYLQWCLDAAEAHWKRNAPKALQEQFVWYVLRHNIEYKAEAFEGEALKVETWVATAEGVKSERRYRILRPSDGKTLIEATTLWCLLDAKSLKPAKISEEIRTLFLKK